MDKRKLALGHQEFAKVRHNSCIYVDKTEQIYNLINSGSYYFLSRPRRFGKSLLINTIKELYSGSKELFKDLWISDKWDWESRYPVIKISFSNIGHNNLGLEQAIARKLAQIASQYGHTLEEQTNSTRLEELITKLSAIGQVVILIDEYDKPIIDYMDDLPQAEANRQILKNFYSIIKDADNYIKFLFISGVSKFSQVSIFSDLNNLIDITIDPRFSTITGFTEDELVGNFGEYIDEIQEKYADIFPNVMDEVRNWYNGYSWDGIKRVYNPVSVMNFFAKQIFSNYWFSTGTPTMLLKTLAEQNLTAFDIENFQSSTQILDKYEISNIKLSSLLFQTGYLTIDKLNIKNGRILLNYPNREVEEAFSVHILSKLTNIYIDKTQNLLYKISDNFLNNKIKDFIVNLNSLFKNIPYSLVDDKEKYYHSLFYLIMKLIGFEIETEILTIDGRIDAVVKTDENIYIIEFKINQSAQLAINQIKEKKYADKYKIDNKKIILIGINFDTEKKCIDFEVF